MIVHVVLFRPRPHLALDARQAFVDAFTTALDRIPSIRRARVGRRVTHGRPYEQLMKVDYEYAAVLEFDDIQGLEVYLEHPAHEQLAAAFFSSSDVALIYDFALGDGATALADLVG